jgi:hypothetical protein
MTSEQRTELVRGHADNDQEVSQGALRHVAARVNWDRNRTPIGMLHHAVAASDPLDDESGAFERLNYLRSRYGRDAARHKPGNYQKSGDVECQSQLVWWPDFINQSFECGAQVGDRLFLRRAIADRADARAELRRGAPHTVLVFLDDVGHVNDTSHKLSMHRPPSHDSSTT